MNEMMKKEKINVAIIGLGFGAEFIPIYQQHPNATYMLFVKEMKRV